jgi:hypothetical protein
MFDKVPPDANAALVDYYQEYAPSRFRLPNGEPVKRRSQQILAKRLRLPLIRCGRSVLIDPQEADNRLRQLAENQTEPGRRRGRPRS